MFFQEVFLTRVRGVPQPQNPEINTTTITTAKSTTSTATTTAKQQQQHPPPQQQQQQQQQQWQQQWQQQGAITTTTVLRPGASPALRSTTIRNRDGVGLGDVRCIGWWYFSLELRTCLRLLQEQRLMQKKIDDTCVENGNRLGVGDTTWVCVVWLLVLECS